MGFQGSLDTVNLADIFQTLAANGQTGTLTVDGPALKRHIWFSRGALVLCDSPIGDGLPLLLHTMVARGFIQQAAAEQLFFRCNNTRQPLRDLILAANVVAPQDLDDIANALIEDLVCEIFEWASGGFQFTDGDPLPDLQGPQVVAMGDIAIQTAGLVMEATRRQDEWQRIREVIPDSDELYVVDNDGRSNLNSLDPDPDMQKVLRYCDGKHQLSDIARICGLSRFDTHAIVAQFVMAGIVRRRGGAETLNDAQELRNEGHLKQACALLENARKRDNDPSILLPLAEMRVELRQIPQAVELYLELVQQCQNERDFDGALRNLETVIGLSPDDPELRLDRATILIELDRLEEAGRSYIEAASDYLQIRDTNAAVDCCHRARDILPRSPEPHRLLARAYLLDGQTDNAVVEYKSLWHSLLTSMRPRKALGQLEDILSEDCKYSTVTEQVLNHAKGSEAVKTASAVRMLVYVVILMIVIGAGFVGKGLFDKYVLLENAQNELGVLRSNVQTADDKTDYKRLLDKLEEIEGRSRDNGFQADVAAVRAALNAAWSESAKTQVARLEEAMASHDYTQAEAILGTLKSRYDDPLSESLPSLSEQFRERKARHGLADSIENATSLWDELEWQQAVERLDKILADKQQLPGKLSQELTALQSEWRTKLGNAEELFHRAERIEVKRGRKAGIAAFTLALNADGDAFKERARARLIELESSYAQDLAQTIVRSGKTNDAKQTFTALDELVALVGGAHSDQPQSVLDSILLPCTVSIGSQHTVLTVTQGNGKSQDFHAPVGKTGVWNHTVLYPATGSVTISAERTGFKSLKDKVIKADQRSLTASIQLERGPLWNRKLPAAPAYRAQHSSGQLLIPLTSNRLAVVDANLGNPQIVHLDQDVGTMPGSPMVFHQVAYVVIADRLSAIDISTRAPLWSWPPDNDPTSIGSFAGSVWVQDHELIPGAIQVFSGTTNGSIFTMAVKGGDTPTIYPVTKIGSAITGPLYADSYEGLHSTLYVPAGNQLLAFDASTVSEQSELSFRYRLDTRGDITARPIRTRVAGQDCLLVVDASGTVTAMSADPTVHSNPVEAIGSWPVQGEITAEPVISNDGRVAVVATRQGFIYALDLNRPGEVAWQYPTSGNIGRPVGASACGSYGVFVADANGMLTCIDTGNGKKLWEYDLGAPAATGPAFFNGRCVVGTTAGTLYCFEEGQP